MEMNKRLPSSIWSSPCDFRERLKALWRENNIADSSFGTNVFFRADDFGSNVESNARLINLFSKHRQKLEIAVVPEWIGANPGFLPKLLAQCPELWTIHMHGFAHCNHALEGKKCEFGIHRSRGQKKRDLLLGLELLDEHLGEFIHRQDGLIFTPPWNRCDDETLKLLWELDFIGISRFAERRRTKELVISSRDVTIDLHTRRDSDAEAGWELLFEELKDGLRDGNPYLRNAPCGIMIHDQLMNENAFEFLDCLLGLVNSNVAVRLDLSS
ncbi:MAG: hypothetical protein ACNI27_06780 [Desulfovibrio sp.]